MRLETGDLETVPVLLTIALGRDANEWWIVLHLHDGTTAEGYLRSADEQEVGVQDESGAHPWGQVVQWTEVGRVVIP